MMVVLLLSLRFFRTRRLGTAGRIALSAVAMVLLLLPVLRGESPESGRIVLAVFAAVVLSAGIWYLWRFERAERQNQQVSGTKESP
ncbi:MAG: hypothetical protein D6691_09065 [Candidatus Hydrogenedentota bacterium]|nr:hypothetical protein [Candidatus Sumerlaea chitinivorans]RMH25830.1 MAG: hypothetical protein D6691_09065 [Candidatus Hydrogenedentota bacterium]